MQKDSQCPTVLTINLLKILISEKSISDSRNTVAPLFLDNRRPIGKCIWIDIENPGAQIIGHNCDDNGSDEIE